MQLKTFFFFFYIFKSQFLKNVFGSKSHQVSAKRTHSSTTHAYLRFAFVLARYRNMQDVQRNEQNSKMILKKKKTLFKETFALFKQEKMEKKSSN